MTRIALFLAIVLLAGYASGNTIRENKNVIDEEVRIPLEAVENNNLELVDNANPVIVTLQGVGPSKQCAGVGQACSSHGDCCTNSCFGILRSYCVPNLGFSLNLQIGAPTGSK